MGISLCFSLEPTNATDRDHISHLEVSSALWDTEGQLCHLDTGPRLNYPPNIADMNIFTQGNLPFIFT